MSLCEPVKNNPLRCYLFTYNGNIVAIDLIGALIPAMIALTFLVILLRRSHGRIPRQSLSGYTALTVMLGGLAALEYTVWNWVFGTLSIDTRFFEFSLILPIALVQFWFLDRTFKIELPLLKSYVVGTFGLFLSDLIRTFSGALNVSPQIIGAREFADAVFLTGPLLMLFYAMSATFYGVTKRARAASALPQSIQSS